MLLDKVPKKEKIKKEKTAYTHSTVSAYMKTDGTPLTGMEKNVYNNKQWLAKPKQDMLVVINWKKIPLRDKVFVHYYIFHLFINELHLVTI